MPLSNATNLQTVEHTPGPALKRKAGDENEEVSSSSGKKSRLTEGEKTDNPYMTLPAPSRTYVQLRFQLCRFKGVYRVVRLPLTFTFANLHTLILFLFGWNGMHLHQSYVYSNVVMYSSNYRRGEIKKCGRAPPMPTDMDEKDLWYHTQFVRKDEPIYRVVKKRRNPRSNGKYSFDDFDDFDTGVVVKEDRELTLGEVWSLDEDRNASEGECTNQEIGIKYEYDLGSSWNVDITIDRDEPFFKYKPGRNTPDVLTAKGAPPIEDASEEEMDEECEGDSKTIPPQLYDPETFVRYCDGQVRTESRETALEIIERRAK